MLTELPPIRLPVPHFPQQQAGDCLAACAMMLLQYANVQVRYARLCSRLEINRFGVPFSNIQHLQQFGLSMVVRQGTLPALHQHLHQHQPIITAVATGELPHWAGENVLHAVVVVGMDAQNVYVNDPEFTNAPVRVPQGDFDLAWLARDELYAVVESQS